jgi:D-alanyl-D-alanine carboxypeptidase
LIAVVLGEPTGRDRTLRAASLLEHGFQMREWKALLGAKSIDTLPMAEDAKGPMTMRQAVISFECGTARRRAVAKRRKGKGQAVGSKPGEEKAGKPHKAVSAAKSLSAQKAASSGTAKAPQ